MTTLRQTRRAFRLMRINRKALFALEGFVKPVATVILVAMLLGLMKLSMRVTGRAYLTRENVAAFIFHPLTLIPALLWMALAHTWAMIDIGAVTFIVEASRVNAVCTVEDALRHSFRNALRAWRPRNLAAFAVSVGLTPLFIVGPAMGLAAGVSIPELVTESIRNNRLLYAGIVAALMLAALLTLPRMYALKRFLFDGEDYGPARAQGMAQSRHRFGDFARLLAGQLAFGAATVLLELLLTLAARGIALALAPINGIQWLPDMLVWYAVVVALAIAWCAHLPYSYVCVSALPDMVAAAAEADPRESVFSARRPVRGASRAALRLGMVALIACAAALLGRLVYTGALNLSIESVRLTEVTAHRGASALYPENTMAAFRAARELGADWVELDVQQTKDGEIIVMHDPNTRRTTGVRGNVWNMTYAEIAALDAGRRFGAEFAGERIPLLSEVAEYARESGVRLNIELKPTGHETDFEKAVVDIVREYGLEDRCVITSQVYRVLTNVKAYDESITTVYVTSFAYGAIDRLTAADHYSVEATSATRRLVSHAHNSGSQIYAWTVNTRRGIKRMIDRNVDNIITDNVALARQCVAESRYGELVSDFVRTLDGE